MINAERICVSCFNQIKSNHKHIICTPTKCHYGRCSRPHMFNLLLTLQTLENADSRSSLSLLHTVLKSSDNLPTVCMGNVNTASMFLCFQCIDRTCLVIFVYLHHLWLALGPVSSFSFTPQPLPPTPTPTMEHAVTVDINWLFVCLHSMAHSWCHTISSVCVLSFLRAFYCSNDFTSSVYVCDCPISCFSPYRSLNAIP